MTLPRGPEKRERVMRMFDAIAPRYDLVNRVMTFGLDVGWRRKAVGSLALPAGSLVLDLACGTGDFCRELRKSRYRAIGFDLSIGMLRVARTTAPLVMADILKLPVADSAADGVTCGFAMRNVTELKTLFDETARVLRGGGRFAFLEVAEPTSPPLRAGHSFYFQKVVPAIGGLLSDKDAYSYLPKSVEYLPPWPEISQMLEGAGFERLGREPLGLGAAQLITGRRI